MTIGELARAAGVSVETVRYYQRRGIIGTPQLPLGGRRQYQPAALRQLHFIRRAQQLGFTLEEIRGLLAIADGRDCEAGRQYAATKYDELGRRVAELNRMRRELRRYTQECEDNRRGQPCPLIDALNGRDGHDGHA